MNASIDRPRLFSHLTRTRFLHIEDALERGKLRFFIGEFERGKGAGKVAYAFLQVESARVILSDLADGKPVDFSDYKGGRSGDNTVISRVLKIRTKDERVWVQLQNGPGVMQEGIIKPSGRTATEISIPLTMFEARTLGHACMAYLNGWSAEVQRRRWAEVKRGE